MFKEDPYIKSIEKYFLTQLGKGIMLSYSDYELISGWKDKNIPLKVIKEAINRAFSDFNSINSLNKDSKIRNLNSIASHIDKSIEMYLDIKVLEDNIYDSESLDTPANNMVKKIEDNMKYIKDKKVLAKVIEYKDRMSNLSNTNKTETFRIINDEQYKLYDGIFNLLSESEKNKIIKECENRLKNRGNITTDAYKKSIISFRNEMLRDRFNLKFLN